MMSAIEIVSGINTSACSSVGQLSRSEEHTSELQSRSDLVCRLLLEKKKKKSIRGRRHFAAHNGSALVSSYARASARGGGLGAAASRDTQTASTREDFAITRVQLL